MAKCGAERTHTPHTARSVYHDKTGRMSRDTISNAHATYEATAVVAGSCVSRRSIIAGSVNSIRRPPPAKAREVTERLRVALLLPKVHRT